MLEAADQRERENSEDALSAAIERLRAADDGPGPHARRLEALIVELSRRTPARTEADLFARFVTALGELNRLTHNKAPADLERARQFLREAFSIATRLFAPMMSRLNVIDELIAAPAPGAGEVAQLVGWHGDPRILSYFFSRVQGPGWFRALADHSLLGPPENSGMWPALGYLQRLGQSDPDELAGWLAGRPRGR